MTDCYDYSFFQWDVILEIITVEMTLSFSGTTPFFLNSNDQRSQNQENFWVGEILKVYDS